MRKNRIREENCPVLYHTPGPASHFFGFHDISPWDAADERIVLLEAPRELWRLPGSGDRARVSIWSPARQEIEAVGETTAWNWQQGARQQWLPGSRDKVIYNARVDERSVSIVRDLATGSEDRKPFSVYSISPDGRLAVSPHFSRLRRYYSSYGYAGGDCPGLDDPAPANDGVYLLDLAGNKVELLLSLAEIAAFKPPLRPDSVFHFVTHLTINPSGTRFCFLHRFKLPGSGLYSRFMAADMDGRNLSIIAEEKVSHFAWYDERTILVWTRFLPATAQAVRRNRVIPPLVQKKVLGVLRKLYPSVKQRLYGESLFLIDVVENAKRRRIGTGVLEQDGHPMFSRDREWIITDTYPDKKRRQLLILYNLKSGIRYNINSFISPERFSDGEFRCDLHPRWNRSNDQVCVDSAHQGRRQVYIIDVSPVIKGGKA